MAQTSSREPAVFYGAGYDVFEITLHEPGAEIERIRESVVQDIWRYQRFDAADLTTVQGSRISVVHPGRLNQDEGPDFLDAVLRIDGTELHGSIEIHITSSGWTAHGHETDSRYNGVILHVVLVADVFTGKLRRKDGSAIEELVLMPRLNASLRDLLYRFYQHQEHDFPCALEWPGVDPGLRRTLIRRLGKDRFREKAKAYAARFQRVPDLDELLHQEVFAALGLAKNAGAMRELAHRIPLTVARRLNRTLELEALHFGVAGLLPAPSELLGTDAETADYVLELAETFVRLNDRFDIPVMPKSMWKFFRLRPNNFPTLRIAQACALLSPGRFLHHDSHGRLIAAIRQEDALASCFELLDTRMNDFWHTHVRLEKKTKPFNPSLGEERKRAVISNVLVPFVLMLIDEHGPDLDEEKIAALAKSLPPENDEITRAYETADFRPSNILETQGIHQLHRTRCAAGRCLQCEIGDAILNG